MSRNNSKKYSEFENEEENGSLDQVGIGSNANGVTRRSSSVEMARTKRTGSDVQESEAMPASVIGSPPVQPYEDDKPVSSEVEKPLNAYGAGAGKKKAGSSPGMLDHLNDFLEMAEKKFSENLTIIKLILIVLVSLGTVAYLAIAITLDLQRATGVIVFFVIIVSYYGWALIEYKYGDDVFEKRIVTPIEEIWETERWFRWGVIIASFIGLLALVVWVFVDTIAEEPYRLVSVAGLFGYVFLLYLMSVDRRAIDWKLVGWGLTLQFLLGVFVLKTNAGRDVFDFIGDQATIFLNYASEGALFVFGAQDPRVFNDPITGEPTMDVTTALAAHQFAFRVLPTIIFFSSFIAVMYHIGLIQLVVAKISWAMERTMGTSAPETLNAVGNIFVGQTEAPLLIKPFLATMTRSELHAVMTGGFATISGGLLAAYTFFGIPAEQLIAASVMSAPAALAVSKIVYPEIEQSKFPAGTKVEIESSGEVNFIEAAANGASSAIPLAANVAANLIAFLSLLAFVDEILAYIGRNLGWICDEEWQDGLYECDDELTFEQICSYLFVPFAFLMGVDPEDSRRVATLLGTKTFVNEFVAYIRLGEMISGNELTSRSIIISIYALCGFANIGSMGIQLGGLGPLAPHRRTDLSELVFSAFVAGTVACFLTACMAGILVEID